MNKCAYAFLALVLLALCIAPTSAANDPRYGYITLDSIHINLHDANATVDMHYTVDEGTRFIFFLLGEQDLKNKLITILNFDNVQAQYINFTDAEFIVNNASYSYGDGVFWFPSHQFNVVVPKLIVETPQTERNFTNTNIFPDGIGYFDSATTSH